ncbi:MAG: tRNA (adenosine(37)-N6)-threonylcarbamoyltransferase complex dimerization subunit type 1 TsaB [Calditrichaceae bacterium]|jgi:tRNA threonylcarbamoyladenosine biosynthesis protein TsaB
MILGIETSDLLCSVAFVDNNQILAEYNHEIPRQHASLLGNIIETGGRFLSSNQLAPDNFIDAIELVSVAIGPGSFTGLRIGLSYAQGFCMAQNIPLVGINNHQILAVQGPGNFNSVFTVIDAHRDEVYLANMEKDEKNYFHTKTHKIVDKKNGLINSIPKESCLIYSNTTILDKSASETLVKKRVTLINGRYSAALLAKIGMQKFRQDGGDNLSELEPLYIRPFAGVQ